MSTVEVFPVRDSVVALAVGIAERYGLRAADSIHLSTMIEIQRASAPTETRLVALIADKSLLEAARDEGVTAVNPEEDGALANLKDLLRS